MHNKSMWAITSYFNPCGYKSRLENYRIFRKHLDIPLIAVELSFNGKYELSSSDADILIRLKGKDLMWQKERLLNIALQSLPESCRKVAWMDCDVVFAKNDWHKKASLLLDQYKVIQLFKKVYHLPSKVNSKAFDVKEIVKNQPFIIEYSYAYNLVSGVRVKNYRRVGGTISKVAGACGVIWAAQKEILTKHGFYDAFIGGGGDSAMAFAGFGRYKELPLLRPLTPQQIKHYYSWAEPYSKAVNSSIKWLSCDVFHLWHGEFIDRNYLSRHEMLNQFNFDPYSDIIFDDEGCWQWNSDKKELHKYMQSYFSCRKEDGAGQV